MKQGVPGISHKTFLRTVGFAFYTDCVTNVYILVSNNKLHFISRFGMLCLSTDNQWISSCTIQNFSPYKYITFRCILLSKK
jgi:hypothetical protein